jgi:AraC-like DNA-binding protein
VNETEKTVANTDAKHQQVLKAIGALLNAEKLYLNPELTIVDLAERIGEHPRLVSTSINRSCGENFNRFINKYRVEEARLRLLNSDVAHLNMEGIGIDAGFNSNSSFYTAFKKELNMTPLQYLKNSKS